MIIVYYSEMETKYLESIVRKYGGYDIDIRKNKNQEIRYFSEWEANYLSGLITKYTWKSR